MVWWATLRRTGCNRRAMGRITILMGSRRRGAAGDDREQFATYTRDEKSGLDYADPMLLDKKFHGDLEATSQGQMLAAQTTVKGSAGYVAIELVRGTLAGKTGIFLMQHSGIMYRGKPSLTVLILPDSGTEELAGISGKMSIGNEGGKHSYALDYQLP